MEEKKFDVQSLIGFLLIGAILLWMLYNNTPTEEELEAEQNTEQVEIPGNTDANEPPTARTEATEIQDSTAMAQARVKDRQQRGKYFSSADAQFQNLRFYPGLPDKRWQRLFQP